MAWLIWIVGSPFLIIGGLNAFMGASLPMNMWSWFIIAMIMSILKQMTSTPVTIGSGGGVSVSAFGVLGTGIKIIFVPIFLIILARLAIGFGVAYLERH